MSLRQLSIALLLLVVATTTKHVSGAYSSNSNSETSAGRMEELKQKLSPGPGDVLDNLDEYDKFWIEVKHSGSCVWSECSVGYVS